MVKKVNTKFGTGYFCLDKTNNVCFYANSLLKVFLSKILDKLQQEEGIYYFVNDNLDTILTIKILSESKDRKTNRTIQKYDVKCFCYGSVNTIKSDKVLELGANDLED